MQLMALSHRRLIVYGLLYVSAMFIGGTLLALIIQAVRSPITPVPMSTPLPVAPLPGLTATPTRAAPTTITPTRRPTVTAIPVRTATAQPVCHVVQWGENLWTIAERYRVTVEDLQRANGIRWPDWIFPGQCLKIP
jgi:LysM repeat protein